MKTIILAAGQGTRLRPYTNDKPKCMVPLAGKPLLHHQMDAMAKCGITENIVIVGGYKIEGMDCRNATLVKNPRYDVTNMVNTLFCAREHITPGTDLLISYGDIVYEPKVLQSVLECDAEVCLAADKEWQRLWKLRMDDPLSDAETFKMDDQCRVKELGKKPNSYEEVQAQYMGLIRIRGDKIDSLLKLYEELDRKALYDGNDFDNMYMTSFIQLIIDKGWDVKACLVENGWLEVDTVEELDAYEKLSTTNELSIVYKLEKYNIPK